MRKLAIAVALASTAMATPAVARDNSFYAGLEGGVMWVEDTDFDYDFGTVHIQDAIVPSHNIGYDVDAIAGYDFGLVRLEGELGYKRASINQIRAALNVSGGGPFDNFDADGRVSAVSAMVNFLLDYGDEDGLSGYGGVGVGVASVRYRGDTTFENGPFGRAARPGGARGSWGRSARGETRPRCP